MHDSAVNSTGVSEHLKCLRCGYDLCGLSNLRCPECGAVYQPIPKCNSAQKAWISSAVIVISATYTPYVWMLFLPGFLHHWSDVAAMSMFPGMLLVSLLGLPVVCALMTTLVMLVVCTLLSVKSRAWRITCMCAAIAFNALNAVALLVFGMMSQ